MGKGRDCLVEPLLSRLRSLGMVVQAEEPLKRHTSFKIGGPAALYWEPENETILLEGLPWVRDSGLPFLMLGLGSNLLVSDAGYPGVVVQSQHALRDAKADHHTLILGAGVPLAKAANVAARHHLSGLEFAISIPGTVGGAVVMNAGAHGSSMMDVVESVEIWDPDSGVREISREDLHYRYRHSVFQEPACQGVALRARVGLRPGLPEEIRDRMRRYMDYRKATQPVGEKNAGSMFKNPPEGKSGALIEAIGAKGWVEGRAHISRLHANFIINDGDASAYDVLTLMRRVRAAVYAQFGAVLRPEVRWVGPAEGEAGTSWENLWLKADVDLPGPSG